MIYRAHPNICTSTIVFRKCTLPAYITYTPLC